MSSTNRPVSAALAVNPLLNGVSPLPSTKAAAIAAAAAAEAIRIASNIASSLNHAVEKSSQQESSLQTNMATAFLDQTCSQINSHNSGKIFSSTSDIPSASKTSGRRNRWGPPNTDSTTISETRTEMVSSTSLSSNDDDNVLKEYSFIF